MGIGMSSMFSDVYQISSNITTANNYDELAGIIEKDIRNLVPYDKAVYILAKRENLTVVKTISHNYSQGDLELIINNRNRIKECIFFNPLDEKIQNTNVIGAASYGFHERIGNYVSLFHCSSSRVENNVNNTKILEILIPRLHSTFVKFHHSVRANNHPIKPLSPRESEILNWISKGKTNHEIGIILGISTYTVKNHVSNILEKLNVANRAEALVKAIMY